MDIYDKQLLLILILFIFLFIYDNAFTATCIDQVEWLQLEELIKF